jgi:hypothetical protein
MKRSDKPNLINEIHDEELDSYKKYLLEERCFVHVEEALDDVKYMLRESSADRDAGKAEFTLDGLKRLQEVLTKHTPASDSPPDDSSAYAELPAGPAPDLLPENDAEFDSVPPPAGFTTFDLRPETLPSEVNLASWFRQIQDQQGRNTCVAFATCALMEYEANRANKVLDFSEQFLYWACKQIDDIPDRSGTFLGWAFRVTPGQGCCLAATWPYRTLSKPGNDAQGPPPTGAQSQAVQYRTAAALFYNKNDVNVLRQSIGAGRPVAYTLPVHPSWWANNPAVRRTGNIPLPIAGEQPSGTHALCLVGYNDQSQRFLIRNSFGSRWGTESSVGVGYGTLPYEFVRRFGLEAYALP